MAKKLQFSLRSLLASLLVVALAVIYIVMVSRREILEYENTVVKNGQELVLVLVGRTVDRWGVNADRLEFVVLCYNCAQGAGASVGIREGRPVLVADDGEIIAVLNDGQLFEVEGTTVKRFRGHVSWEEWKEFIDKSDEFGIPALLRSIASE